MKRYMKWLPMQAAILFVAAQPLMAQGGDSGLRVFGHLTQGAGVAGEEAIHGVPTTGTTDLRTMALQFRYGLGDANEVVVQLKHQRLGMSPLQQLQDDVELQWAFYQHRFGPMRVRVGRAPVPFGLFNEMRDVGTVLPFYRVPHHLYPQGTEATDGVVLGYQIGSALDWNLLWEAFVGTTGYQGAFHTPLPEFPVFIIDLKVEKTVGTQVWIGTPLPGLRVGGAVQTLTFDEEDLGPDPDPDLGNRATVWMGSIDGAFDRFTIRSEAAFTDTPWFTVRTLMAQAGGWMIPSLGVFGQAEIVDQDDLVPFDMPERRQSEDYGLALNYKVTPSAVLKIEGHRVTGYSFERWVDLRGPHAESFYGIASIAVSF